MAGTGTACPAGSARRSFFLRAMSTASGCFAKFRSRPRRETAEGCFAKFRSRPRHETAEGCFAKFRSRPRRGRAEGCFAKFRSRPRRGRAEGCFAKFRSRPRRGRAEGCFAKSCLNPARPRPGLAAARLDVGATGSGLRTHVPLLRASCAVAVTSLLRLFHSGAVNARVKSWPQAPVDNEVANAPLPKFGIHRGTF